VLIFNEFGLTMPIRAPKWRCLRGIHLYGLLKHVIQRIDRLGQSNCLCAAHPFTQLTKSYALQWIRHSPKSGPSRGNICTPTHTWFPGLIRVSIPIQTASRSVQPFLHISP